MQKAKMVAVPILILLCSCAINQYEDIAIYKDLINLDIGKHITQPEKPKQIVQEIEKVEKQKEIEQPAIKPKSEYDIVKERGYVTLEDCYRIATEYNERLAISGEDYLQSLLLKDQAISAIMPKLTLAGTYFQQNSVSLGAGGGGFFTLDPKRYQYYFTLKQPIFSGFKDFATLRQTNHNIQANREALHQAELSLFFDVADSFYTVLSVEAEVNTIEESVKVEEERLREINARQTLGLARKTEVFLIEAQLAQDRAKLASAKSRCEIAMAQLYALVGQPLEDITFKDTIEYPEAPGIEGVFVEEALAKRPDLKEKEAQTKAALEGVSVVKADYLPIVDLTANQYTHRRNFSTFQEKTNWDFTVGLTLPLFEGFLTLAKHRDAYSKYRQAELVEKNFKRQVAVQVKSAYSTFVTNTALISNYNTALKSAEENYRLIKEEYRQGIAINLEVMTANNLLLQARLDLQRQNFVKKLDWLKLQVTQGKLPLAGVKW